MKKKILLMIAIISVLVCVFAFSVNAAEPAYNDGEWIYAADGTTKLAIRDTEGNPLVWYMNGDELKYVRADQTDETQPVYIKYAISAGGSGFDTKVFSPQKTLKEMTFPLSRLRPIEEAIITSGGVNTKEIRPGTMESKLHPGLYFAGEVIDVDAYTGGFNLQIAFSTGYLAGKSAAE